MNFSTNLLWKSDFVMTTKVVDHEIISCKSFKFISCTELQLLAFSYHWIFCTT